MPETFRRTRRSINGAHRGQTLIIALAVLFVLLFIGALFVAQIARNLSDAGRGRDTGIADALAEAGINYADSQLTNGQDGADWRPDPTGPMTTAKDQYGVTDPDFQWLSLGYARVPFNGGRFLLRVSYDPRPDDPRSQMLRVDVVGRPGDLGSGQDPTVFVQSGPAPRLRSERVMYKQLGLTDYVRYITNKDRRVTEAVLGTPAIGQPVATVYGDPTLALSSYSNGIYTDPVSGQQQIVFGAPIYSNANLRAVGDVYFYESPRGNTSQQLSPEGVFVAGNILLGPTRSTPGVAGTTAGDYQVSVNSAINSSQTDGNGNPAPLLQPNQIVRPSDDPAFSTVGGLVRDSSTASDASGYSRSVPRLEPPILNSPVLGTDVSRYVAATRDSGVWLNQNFNTGQNGWGTGIYIDNPDDIQSETQRAGIVGSSSLRSEWLNPKGTHWNGPEYTPPGVQVELLGDHIRLTRNDNRAFTDPLGNPITAQGGKVLDIPLSDAARASYVAPNGTAFSLPPLPRDGDDPASHSATAAEFPIDKGSYGVNVVLYATGNVRVRGVFGGITHLGQANEDKLARVHITVVTNGTAYVDGSVVKGDGYVDSNSVFHPERASTCAILAKDYVSVNTTQFMRPLLASRWQSEAGDASEYYVPVTPGQAFSTAFSFGVPPATYGVTNGSTLEASPLFLMMQHAAEGADPTYINMLVNPALATTANGNDTAEYAFNTAPTLLYTYALGASYDAATGQFVPSTNSGIAPHMEAKAFPLRGEYTNGVFVPDYTDPANSSNTSALFFPTLVGVNHQAGGTADGPAAAGYDNIVQIQLDNSGAAGSSGTSNYQYGGAFVAPMDVRIEALLYAQDRSFFIIPGPALNNNANDTRAAYSTTGRRASYTTDAQGNVIDTPAAQRAKDIYPFAQEPSDIRITVFGAIAENYTASLGDQTIWMERFGWIPGAFGSSSLQVPDDHLRVHDAVVTDSAGAAVYKYNPAEARVDPSTNLATDYRTVLEASSTAPQITHGLRYVYDPAFALPYAQANSANLNDRDDRALRFKAINLAGGNSKFVLNMKFKLPPIPRLPVCPGRVEFGGDQRTIGA